MKKCNPGYLVGDSTPFYLPLDNGKLMGWTGDGTPCSFYPTKTTSSGYSNGWVNASSSRYNSAIRNLDKSLTTLPESTPYVRPEFVPYTPPVNSFLEEPKYIPPTVNTLPKYTTGDNYIIQELTTNLSKWQNLTYIDFSGKQLGDDSCRQFNEAFRDAKLPNLLTLVLYNNQISDSGGQYLAYSLIHHYNNNLTTLILANNNLTNNGVTPFADAFNQINTTTFSNGAISRGQITKLKTLDLRGNSKICFSGKLYFFQGIDKCKTKDTSILFDEFTIKTGDIHSLTSNNKLLNDSHIPWITGAFPYQWLTSIHNLNLSHNQIGDGGAKLLASSLSKGEMPNLKKLHLEGNKITDEGQDALINALKNETVQDVIITAITLYEKYQLNISGNKEKQRSILENQLERAKAHGVDVDNVVVEKTAWGWIKNKTNFNIKIAFGWTKCFISYDDIESFAGERLLAKASKKLSWVNDVKDVVLCYFEAESEALLTESGVRDIKYQILEVQETPELVGNIEAWYEHIY